MGSTGEADKKRRHFSSLSPATAAAKKQPLVPLSEEKKLDATVLQFQNQKLTQKLETQKVEIHALEGKLDQFKGKQSLHDKVESVVDISWKKLVDELESHSYCILDSVNHRKEFESYLVKDDGNLPSEDTLLSRLLETGATESSSARAIVNPTEDRKVDEQTIKKPEIIVRNIVASIDSLSNLKHRLFTAYLKAVPSNEQSQEAISPDTPPDTLSEVNNLRMVFLELHLKHRLLAGELQSHRDTDAKNKAALKRLKGELESTVDELEECNCNLAALKSERGVTKGAGFPVLSPRSKRASNDKMSDKQRDVQDMESTLKEMLDQSSSRLQELKCLHEDRLDILRYLSKLQSNVKSIRCISSTQAYCLLKDQLEKAKADVTQFQALYEKLQVEKEGLYWREKESQMKNELVDVLHRCSAVASSRVRDLEVEIQKCIKEKDQIKAKLDEASKEPGRKEIIADFRALVSSFPDKMGSMQNQLAKHKETATGIHYLRANVESLTNILHRKGKELESLTSKSAQHNAEIQKCQDVIRDLKVMEMDLKLFLELFGQQSIDSREVSEARRSEISAWAHVQSLKSSLDEYTLEMRVKDAIEAEAKAQQRLAESETEIAELRQKLEARKREKSKLADVLKSGHEETEAYLSEIETIGQAYDDMQTQNQQLLQQVTERDDYNVKLVLEGVRAKQAGDSLLMEKRMLEKAVLQTKRTVEFSEIKARRIEDQLKACLDHMHRVSEDRAHSATAVENMQRRLLDVRRTSQQVTSKLDETQSQVESSRAHLTELKIELETERFERKRLEEDIEMMQRKAQQLKLQAEGSSAFQKLRQELGEYKEILKCSVCLDRRKEVVITKCFHLLCNPCVQRTIESRHRKCPVCAASFGANDVKPVYI